MISYILMHMMDLAVFFFSWFLVGYFWGTNKGILLNIFLFFNLNKSDKNILMPPF